jgi:hypothetical protein
VAAQPARLAPANAAPACMAPRREIGQGPARTQPSVAAAP